MSRPAAEPASEPAGDPAGDPAVTVAYFDCLSGISGDMVLGALVDAGLSLPALQREVDKLGIDAQLRARHVDRCGLRAMRVQVEIGGRVVSADHEHHLQAPSPPTAGEHGDVQGHDHEHGHDHDHDRGGGPRHAGGHAHTHLTQLLERIDASRLPPEDKRLTARVFRRLAEAEARVHGLPVEDVGLHEVGSLDALVDIAGAVAGLRLLGVTRVLSSPLHVGTGTVTCAHGRYPVPVPGVLALCEGVPLVQTDLPFELVTPTGAALITTLADGFGPAPALRLQAVGYGAGGRDLEAQPNVVRLRLAAAEAGGGDGRRCVLVEANVDDMNPEVYGYLFERLLEAGARDVYVTPVLMKKNRPGQLLSVLADPERLEAVSDVILGETTSLGVRYHEVERRILERSQMTAQTRFGAVRVKVAVVDGRRRVAPEYDDCAEAARRHGVPILTVYGAAVSAAEESFR